LFREFAEKRLLAFFRTQQKTKQEAGAIYKGKSSQKAVMKVKETQKSRKRHILSKVNSISTSQGNFNCILYLHISFSYTISLENFRHSRRRFCVKS
jgi:hypothetical protein